MLRFRCFACDALPVMLYFRCFTFDAPLSTLFFRRSALGTALPEAIAAMHTVEREQFEELSIARSTSRYFSFFVKRYRAWCVRAKYSKYLTTDRTAMSYYLIASLVAVWVLLCNFSRYTRSIKSLKSVRDERFALTWCELKS